MQAFSSLVKVEFWTELATKKLDTYRLNDDAQVRTGLNCNFPRLCDKCTTRVSRLKGSFSLWLSPLSA